MATRQSLRSPDVLQYITIGNHARSGQDTQDIIFILSSPQIPNPLPNLNLLHSHFIFFSWWFMYSMYVVFYYITLEDTNEPSRLAFLNILWRYE